MTSEQLAKVWGGIKAAYTGVNATRDAEVIAATITVMVRNGKSVTYESFTFPQEQQVEMGDAE